MTQDIYNLKATSHKIFISYKEKRSKFAVEKPEKYNLNLMIMLTSPVMGQI